MNAIASFFAGTRAIFALPAMSEQELVAFRKAQGDVRDPLVVPTVVCAVLMIAGFVGWDQMRDPGHLGPAASTTLTSESLARGNPMTPKNITISRPGICNGESGPRARAIAACSP